MKLFAILCFLAVVSMAQSRRDVPMLVTVPWLENYLPQPGLVILHVGSQKDYDAGHIPGARLATLADLSVTGEAGLRLELPPPATLSAALGRLGITPNSRIVIYPANESVQSATRVWLTLEWAGLAARASLLDGGLAAWQAAQKPLETTARAAAETPGPAVVPHPELLVDKNWVRDNGQKPTVALLDARLPQFYTGAEQGIGNRLGHIPGARNLPFISLLDADRKLKPAAELRQLFAEAGVTDTKQLAIYCHIGQQATLLYFAAKSVGFEPKLYDGSFQEWSMQADFPVVTGK